MKVEIGQYHAVNKGKWAATFMLIIDTEGAKQKILDCRYFVDGDRRWFGFPQKVKYNKDPEAKPEYLPLITYLNKDYQQELQSLVLDALKNINPKENHGQTKNQTYASPNNAISSESQADRSWPPF